MEQTVSFSAELSQTAPEAVPPFLQAPARQAKYPGICRHQPALISTWQTNTQHLGHYLDMHTYTIPITSTSGTRNH